MIGAEGSYNGLSNFLAAGGTLDQYLVRMAPNIAFPQSSSVPADTTTTALSTLDQFGRRPAIRQGATRIAKFGGKTIPLAGGLLQAVSGDPIGGVGTAAGGVAGGAIGGILTAGNPLGIAAGSLIGSSLGSSGARGLAGINLGDPLSGPDISIPIFGGIPISPYAKTKKSRERAREERKKDMEAMRPFLQEQLARSMAMQQQAITGNLMQSVINASRR